MKTEIELHLFEPGIYYSEYDELFNRGAQLCARGLARYVKLPKATRQITLCFFKRYVPESFEIGRRNVKPGYDWSLLYRETQGYCLIDHPKLDMLMSFRRELYRYYIKGYKFFRIEY